MTAGWFWGGGVWGLGVEPGLGVGGVGVLLKVALVLSASVFSSFFLVFGFQGFAVSCGWVVASCVLVSLLLGSQLPCFAEGVWAVFGARWSCCRVRPQPGPASSAACACWVLLGGALCFLRAVSCPSSFPVTHLSLSGSCFVIPRLPTGCGGVV